MTRARRCALKQMALGVKEPEGPQHGTGPACELGNLFLRLAELFICGDLGLVIILPLVLLILHTP